MRNNIIILIVALLLVGGIYWFKTNTNPTVEEPVVEIEYKQVLYQGNGFSFEYSDKYERSPEGLWTKDLYFYYLYPRLDMPGDRVSDINVYIYETQGTMGEYFQLLYEIGEPSFEEVVIADHTFSKFVIDYKQYTIVHYAIKEEDIIYVFRVFSLENDNQELFEIISTLQINQE